MQTPAERCLIEKIIESLPQPEKKLSTVLNIGAGQSVVIERAFAKEVENLVCDRVDIESHHVNHPCVRNEYKASIESMPNVPSNTYDVAFANYVLEHVPKIDSAAKEIHRVLKDEGIFVASIPNPNAPEFFVSRITPKWFHQLIKGEGKGKEAFETHYAYKNVRTLNKIFESTGFEIIEVKYFSFIRGYLYRFPLLNTLSKIYDAILNFLKIKSLMGHVCVVYRKRI